MAGAGQPRNAAYATALPEAAMSAVVRVNPNRRQAAYNHAVRSPTWNPEMASRVRGLASQRAFLSDPDAELQTNLSYCTAIAWLMQQRAGGISEQSENAARASA